MATHPVAGASVFNTNCTRGWSTSISCDGSNGRGGGRNSGYGQRLSRGQRLRLIAGNPFDKLRGSMDLHGFTTVTGQSGCMGCNVNVCGCPFRSSHHATCSEMQRNAPADAADAGPRGPIFAFTSQFSEKWPEAPLCPRSLRHSALHLPTSHRLNRLQIVEINAPFLHFKAASFSTPSLRVTIWGLVQPRQGSR